MYEFGTLEIFYSSVLFAVLSMARYRLYKSRLRLPLKYLYIIIASTSVFISALWVLLHGIPGIGYDAYRIIYSIVMFAFSCVIIKAPFVENAFSYAFILAFTASVETTAFYARLNFFPNAPEYIYPVISVIIIAIAFLPGFRGLNNMITRLGKLGSDRIWGWLDLVCFSFLFMNLLILKPHPAEMNLYYPLSRYLMLLGMVGVYKVVIRIMDIMQAAVNAQTELSLMSRRISVQQDYYNRMVKQMDEVRRMRHDLRYHRAVLSALVKSGDSEALSSYITTFDETEKAFPVSGNLAADSILLYYMDEAGASGVKTDITLTLGRKAPIPDSDLCVILGNLLENALDAQKYLAPEKRYLRVTASGDEKSLTLAVDNRFDGVLSKNENGLFFSRKSGEGHGMGLASVQAICEKYGGVLQLETEGDMFMAGVVIGF